MVALCCVVVLLLYGVVLLCGCVMDLLCCRGVVLLCVCGVLFVFFVYVRGVS